MSPPALRLGAHMSIAGGVDRAVARAVRVGCTALQVFTKSSSQWAARPLGTEEVARFRSAVKNAALHPVLAHDSYLINPASPVLDLHRRSLTALREEVERCERLEIAFLVLHPGAHVGSGEAAGLKRVARSLDQVHRETRGVRTRMLLENTAGQGSTLGWRFEHLASILDRVAEPERLGICLDTCHAFAAGYDLRTAKAYRATWETIDEVLGLERVMAFHLNDSRKDLGSRVDRHEQIGRGCLGLEAFRLLVNDRRFRGRPMVLETEKREGEFLDEQNLALLRALVGAGRVPTPRQAAAIRRRARSVASRQSGERP